MNHTIEDDLKKLEFYTNAHFEFFDSILFSSIAKRPSKESFEKMKSELTKTQIERLYNHVHLSAITPDPKKQRDFASKIWNAWRRFFENAPEMKNIIIEIDDFGQDITLYAYANDQK